MEYHPQMLQEYIEGGEQTSFLYPSGVDRFRQQFAHLEENYSRGETSSPLRRRHASLPRERVCISKGTHNQDYNSGNRRKASCVVQTISSPGPQEEGQKHAYVYQNGTNIQNFCSGCYLENASTSASGSVVQGNKGLKKNGISEEIEEKVVYEVSDRLAMMHS